MELQLVSYDQVKALKKLGYPQFDEYRNHTAYFTGNHSYMRDDFCQVSQMDKELIFPCDWEDRYNYENHDYCGDFINAPTYVQAWLWLWREKNIQITIGVDFCCIWIPDKKGNYKSKTIIKNNDPEESIIAAIEYLINNDLIK